MEPVEEPVLVSVPEALWTDRDQALEVLQNIDGVSGATYFGTEGHKSKQFGINLYVRRDLRSYREQIRVSCGADKPTQLDAARAARQRIVSILGVAAVEAAEQLVTERRAAAGSTAGVERTVNAVLGLTRL